AGEFLIFKAAGAAADFGYNLEEVVRVANKANDNTRSMGVGLTPCALPQTGEPSFEINDDEMEIGLGHHGEAGIEKGKVATADEVAERLVHEIVADSPLQAGDEVAVLVNGLGSTPRMELYIVYRKVQQILEEMKVSIYRSYVGDFITSLEMGGCSVTLMQLDDELKKTIDHPVDCPMFIQKLVAMIESEKDYLCELDRKIGDGDHGVTMSIGFQAVNEVLDDELSNEQDCSKISVKVGKTFLNAVGSSVGPLYATGFMRGA